LPLQLPSTAEVLLVTCKVARLPEVQQVPRALRLCSTFELVSYAFEELPSICEASSNLLSPGKDACEQWDELIEQLTRRLEDKTDRGPLSSSQHEELIRAVVEVLFGDSLVAELTDEIISQLMPDSSPDEALPASMPSSGSTASALATLMQGKGAAMGEVDRREALVDKWSAQLERDAHEISEIVDGLLAQLESALPWAVRKPLCGKLYDEFERLHAHMRLMLAQALVFPLMTEPLSARQQDALVLDLIDGVLSELNLYSHECSTLALMAEATAQQRRSAHRTTAADSDDALRAGLQWQVEQHERQLRKLRQHITELDARKEQEHNQG